MLTLLPWEEAVAVLCQPLHASVELLFALWPYLAVQSVLLHVPPISASQCTIQGELIEFLYLIKLGI